MNEIEYYIKRNCNFDIMLSVSRHMYCRYWLVKNMHTQNHSTVFTTHELTSVHYTHCHVRIMCMKNKQYETRGQPWKRPNWVSVVWLNLCLVMMMIMIMKLNYAAIPCHTPAIERYQLKF